MAKKKLNPEVVRRIQEAKRRGASYDQIAADFGVSIGSVATALKVRQEPALPASSAAEAPPVRPETPASPEGAAALDDGDLRGFVGDEIAALRAAMGAPGITPTERSTLARTLTMLVALSHRLTPPAPPDPNDNPDMVALGAKVAEQLHKYVDFVLGDAPTGPPCPMCKRPISIPNHGEPT